MPILFVVVGVLFVLIASGMVFSVDTSKRFFLSFLLFVFELSFFVGMLELSGLTFNVIHLVLYFVLLSFFINSISIRSLTFSILFSLIYYLVLSDSDIISDYTFYKYLFFISLFLVSLFIGNSFRFRIAFLLVSSLGMLLVNLFFDYRLYTFAEVDFLYVFNYIFIASLFYLIFMKFKWRGFYAKKCFNISSFNGYLVGKYGKYKYFS